MDNLLSKLAQNNHPDFPNQFAHIKEALLAIIPEIQQLQARVAVLEGEIAALQAQSAVATASAEQAGREALA